MSSLAYHAPETIKQAVSLLAGNPEAKILSGGTDLLVQMRGGRVTPGAIVDLKRIDAMSGIHTLADGGLAIGAATACTVAIKAGRMELCTRKRVLSAQPCPQLVLSMPTAAMAAP